MAQGARVALCYRFVPICNIVTYGADLTFLFPPLNTSFFAGKLPRKEQEIVQFGKLLINGVVLCEVANFLHRGAIKTYDARPHKVFMCIGNIDLFLTTCTTFFGFPHDEELFTATELWELENFAKVRTKLCADDKYAQHLYSFTHDTHLQFTA